MVPISCCPRLDRPDRQGRNPRPAALRATLAAPWGQGGTEGRPPQIWTLYGAHRGAA